MQIVDSGEFVEVRLPFYLNAIPKGKRPTPAWSVCSAFLVATCDIRNQVGRYSLG